MFITSRFDPGELLAHFLDLRGPSEDETSAFCRVRHNHDLCPRFRRNVDALLTTYSGYRTSAHDLQGFNDDGVDVMLRYEIDSGEPQYAALQIKSDQEFDTWKEGDMIRSLRAQYGQAILNRQVDRYYIVLCVDAVKHRDRVRSVVSNFADKENVRVIIPQKALAFFGLTEQDLQLMATRLLCADDPLMLAARKHVEDWGRPRVKLLLGVIRHTFETGPSCSLDFLQCLFTATCEPVSSASDEGGQDFVDAVEWLEGGNIIEPSPDGETFSIDATALSVPLCAIYFDQRHRLGTAKHLEALLAGDEG